MCRIPERGKQWQKSLQRRHLRSRSVSGGVCIYLVPHCLEIACRSGCQHAKLHSLGTPSIAGSESLIHSRLIVLQISVNKTERSKSIRKEHRFDSRPGLPVKTFG